MYRSIIRVNKWIKILAKEIQNHGVSWLFDYLKLYFRKHLRLQEYYDFNFWEQSSSFKKSFLGIDEQRIYLDYLNPVKYYITARNKFICHKMMENIGIKKPYLYCYYNPEGAYDGDCIAGDFKVVKDILLSKNVKRCIIKTTESSHGDNVLLIKDIEYSNNDALLTRFNGETILLSNLLKDEPLIFESIVKQTDQFSKFNESSVNTIRFMTSLYPNKEVKIVAIFIKIGRKGNVVDNAGGGGNISPVLI